MRKKVLLVDDEYDIIFPLDLALSSEGYKVYTAFNGRDALDEIREGLRPDIIITDIMMPFLNGKDFILKLKELKEVGPVPIIVMSAGPNPFSLDKSIPYFRKPFDLDKFMQLVSELAGPPHTDSATEHEIAPHVVKLLGKRPARRD